jgi:hypothetical protein
MGDGRVMVVDPETLSTELLVDDATDIACSGDVAWIAREGQLERRDGGPGLVVPVGVDQLEVDARTGLVMALVGEELQLIGPLGVLARASLGDDVVSRVLVPPGGVGDAVLVDGTQLSVFGLTRVEPTRPPLDVFVMTTLEQPFADADKPCTEADGPDPFSVYLERLRANIASLGSLDVPVAVGVTWEFAAKADDCGEIGILDELADAGFELGLMIHDRPCFSCTDGAVAGETPAECAPSNPDYAPAESPTACWPSNPEYCARGDDQCWLDVLSERALRVDQWIEGGAAFVHGADRHALWDWDWASGYRNLPRADGSVGYDTTLFAAQWVYDDVVNPQDPRGKEPAPRDPELLGTTWYVGSAQDWDRDSAFSNLLYLPGSSIATLRLWEKDRSGLTLVHLAQEELGTAFDRRDLDVLTGRMRQAAGHRRDGRSGAFNFHLRDLTTWLLDDPVADESALATLVDWREDLDATWGENGAGILRWRGVRAIRDSADQEN